MLKLKTSKKTLDLEQINYLIITPRNFTKALKSITNEVHSKSVYAEFNQYGNPYDFDEENRQILNFNKANFTKSILVVVEVNGGRILPIKEWVDYILNTFCPNLRLVVYGASKNQQDYYKAIHNDILFVSEFNREHMLNIQGYLN